MRMIELSHGLRICLAVIMFYTNVEVPNESDGRGASEILHVFLRVQLN